MWWKLKASYESLPQSESKAGETSASTSWFAHRWPRSTVCLGLTNFITLAVLFYNLSPSQSRTVFLQQCTKSLSTMCEYGVCLSPVKVVTG
ncbi:hypothetical protein BDP55DRAFT_659814 [Colletotrichum godetiae]|uniref:Uncharacterized protein n=1 Tax=Colletotrichum godetiae TaxID=1209918 RepID=A0AAJ0AN93_9PEZI|nr:uncharacterized protein BDP55DRAFT_659814 [Colletotrichum godetiae]KAK1687322.1 hypothetical protein BDP55DRAFT_659814 [Colletotrichum godetiae]